MRLFGYILMLVLASQAALAQSTYTSWKNPDAAASAAMADSKLQDLVSRLNTLVDKAEQARAADPVFLRDLRDLARGFDRPWQSVVLQDAFIDGNFEHDPVWQVLAGDYWVEKGWGLRSAITTQAPATETEPTRQRNKDAAVALFGQILNQALGGQQQAGPQPAAGPSQAIIHSAARISNAFALDASVSSWTGEGRLEFAIYQGQVSSAARTQGYRLAYVPGGRIELVRVSSRGTAIMDSAMLPSPLEDKNFHAIEWLRYADGRMTVRVDGQQALSVSDRGFHDSFNGMALINHGGDYILKSVQISGVK